MKICCKCLGSCEEIYDICTTCSRKIVKESLERGGKKINFV